MGLRVTVTGTEQLQCRKKTWWQQEFAVFKCEATANSVTGHVCVNSNSRIEIMDERFLWY